MEGVEEDGSRVRAVFSGIGPDRFRWTALISADGGATWRMEQEIVAVRRAALTAIPDPRTAPAGGIPSG